MPYKPEEVIKALQPVAEEMNLGKRVQKVIFKEDFGEYQIILDGTHHCVIRGKIIDFFISSDDKDSLKDIKFRLQHAVQFSEWEQIDQQKAEKKDQKGSDDDIVIDGGSDDDIVIDD